LTLPNIVLVGFMGSGKSSVGRELARCTGHRFRDTDLLVRSRAGKSIPEIFAAHGEGYFREQEKEVLSLLQTERAMVLATGGGIVLDPANRRLLRRLGPVVWLIADETTIWERVSRNPNRPLLHTANPRQTVHQLLEARHGFYAAVADFSIDSSGFNHQQVARQVLATVRDWSGRGDEGSTQDSGP
jgi:shikimate kinase